jgi:hypothetical protein
LNFDRKNSDHLPAYQGSFYSDQGKLSSITGNRTL